MNGMNLMTDWKMIVFVIFCILSGIQLLYWLLLFSRLAFHKSKAGKKETGNRRPVTVIVCARDEAENLTRNLQGILIQDYPFTHEVIVVNDNSVDDSKYLLSEYKNIFPQLKVIELTQEAKMIPGKKFPLSIGIKSASHDWVLLTDADCVPATENWIRSMESHYTEEAELVLGFGPYHRNKTLLNKLVRWETFHAALQYLSYALAGIPYMGVGRNLSYKKDLFFRLKGFSSHHNIPGGDDDLFVNMAANGKNTAINIDPDSFTYSRPPAGWKQWFTQKSRHYSTARHYKLKHRFLLGTYSISQFWYYPAFIGALYVNWQYAVGIFAGRWLLMAGVIYSSSRKLGEKDLFPWFPVFDMLTFFYYLIFFPALFKKNRYNWK